MYELLIIIVLILIAILINEFACYFISNIVRGGASANSVIVVDGMNMIHHIESGVVKPDRFFPLIDEASLRLTSTFPDAEIHFVFKNLNVHTFNSTDTFNESIKDLSVRYPIYYHLAYDNCDHSGRPHYFSARDDLLVVMLSHKHNAYVLSRDEFRDIDTFKKVPFFSEIIYYRGNITINEINPSELTPLPIKNLIKFE